MNKPIITSHDYARELQKNAEFLLSRPSFNFEGSWGEPHHYFRFAYRESFLACVKALGSGQKKFTEDEIEFKVQFPSSVIKVEAPRATVCRLIRPAEYECDPFLSPDEEQNLGGAA
jgi:hypothetical protein